MVRRLGREHSRRLGATLGNSKQEGEGEREKDGSLGRDGSSIVGTWSLLNLLPNTEHFVKVLKEPQGPECLRGRKRQGASLL